MVFSVWKDYLEKVLESKMCEKQNLEGSNHREN